MAANESYFVGTAGAYTSAAIRANEKRYYETRFYLAVALTLAGLLTVGFQRLFF